MGQSFGIPTDLAIIPCNAIRCTWAEVEPQPLQLATGHRSCPSQAPPFSPRPITEAVEFIGGGDSAGMSATC